MIKAVDGHMAATLGKICLSPWDSMGLPSIFRHDQVLVTPRETKRQ